MGLQRVIECPECGERWTVERNVSGGWTNADRCPKCGTIIMKS